MRTSDSYPELLRSLMRRHKHRWEKTHVDVRCHYNTHHYVCRCGAEAVALIEHLPGRPEEEWCPRCETLDGGAVRRRSVRVTAINGAIEEDIDEPIPARPDGHQSHP